MNSPKIVVSYVEGFPNVALKELCDSLSEGNLDVVLDEREKPGPWMGIEWFLPTAAIIFISKSYFDAFLKEAGKDHYHKLKKKIASATIKTMSLPRIEPVILGTEGKIRRSNPYSMALSLYAEANDGNKFKLLLPKPAEQIDYSLIVSSFLDFLYEYHEGVKLVTDIGFDSNSMAPGRMILVSYNSESSKIQWVNHFDGM